MYPNAIQFCLGCSAISSLTVVTYILVTIVTHQHMRIRPKYERLERAVDKTSENFGRVIGKLRSDP